MTTLTLLNPEKSQNNCTLSSEPISTETRNKFEKIVNRLIVSQIKLICDSLKQSLTAETIHSELVRSKKSNRLRVFKKGDHFNFCTPPSNGKPNAECYDLKVETLHINTFLGLKKMIPPRKLTENKIEECLKKTPLHTLLKTYTKGKNQASREVYTDCADIIRDQLPSILRDGILHFFLEKKGILPEIMFVYTLSHFAKCLEGNPSPKQLANSEICKRFEKYYPDANVLGTVVKEIEKLFQVHLGIKLESQRWDLHANPRLVEKNEEHRIYKKNYFKSI